MQKEMQLCCFYPNEEGEIDSLNASVTAQNTRIWRNRKTEENGEIVLE